MIQRFNKFIFMFKKMGYQSGLSRRGQTSLIMILLAACALILFAATLNIGKTAQVKAQTTMAANNAVSFIASGAASYSQKTMKEKLGGRLFKCGWTLLAVYFLLGFIIGGPLGLLYTITMSAAATAIGGMAAFLLLGMSPISIQAGIVNPKLTRLWNRLQQDTSTPGRFIEQAIQTGLQGVVGDTVFLPDYFDTNNNGQFQGNSDDKASRFGIFYTDRLKTTEARTSSSVADFKAELQKTLFVHPSKYTECTPAIMGLDIASRPLCCQIDPAVGAAPAVDLRPANCSFAISDPCRDLSRAECNPCCVPLYNDEIVPNPRYAADGPVMTPQQCLATPGAACNAPNMFQRVRPSYCSNEFVPAECASNSAYDGPQPQAQYPFTYDAAAQNTEDDKFLSFLERLGRDDEHQAFMRNAADPLIRPQAVDTADVLTNHDAGTYRPEDATGYFPSEKNKNEGIFPMLWAMRDTTRFALGQVPLATAAPIIDNAAPMAAANYATTPNACAVQEGENSSASFYWKPGAPRYCAVVENQLDPATSAQAAPFYTGPPMSYYMAKWPYNANCPDRDLGQVCDPNASSQCNLACPGPARRGEAFPEDPLDDMAYRMGEFTTWAKEFLEKDTAELQKNMNEWFPGAAEWIAPACPTSCDPNSSTTVPDCLGCNPGQEGWLIRFKRQMGGAGLGADGNPQGGWYRIMDDWLEDTPIVHANAWCVPTTADIATMSPDEKYTIFGPMNATAETQLVTATSSAARTLKANVANYTSTNVKLKEVTQCLVWNKTDDQRVNNCIDACSSATTTDYDACYNLPRSKVTGFIAPALTVGAPTTAQKTAAAPLARCLNSCSVANCGSIPGFSPTMCSAPGVWDSANPGAAFKQTLIIRINNISHYGNTVCGNFDKLLAVRDEAVRQSPLFTARHDFLKPVYDKAVAARQLFKDGFIQLGNILEKAQGLIGDHANHYEPSARLPNFAIYGWQSAKQTVPVSDGVAPRGRWHIVRVEAFGPERCGVGKDDCRVQLAWVKTRTKWFGARRCYNLTDYAGSAYVRVTSYTEGNNSSIVNFANQGVRLWKFLGGSASNDALDPAGLGNVCLKVGLHPDTKNALNLGTATAGINIPDDEEDKFNKAFMINKVENGINKACFDLADGLLRTGIKTESCAQYYYDGGNITLKFRKCPAGTFPDGTDIRE